MAKYHINPSNGQVGVCHAVTNCPFGDLQKDHYSSAEDARAHYEEKMSGAHSSVPSLKKREVLQANTSAKKALKNNSLGKATKNFMNDHVPGGKTHEKTIADATSRASLAKEYFANKNGASKKSILDGNSSPASPEVATSARAALDAARSRSAQERDDAIAAYASTGSTGSVSSYNDALSARNSGSGGFGFSAGMATMGFSTMFH